MPAWLIVCEKVRKGDDPDKAAFEASDTLENKGER